MTQQLEHPEIFALEAERGIDAERVNAEREAEEAAAIAEERRRAALDAAQLALF